MTAAIFLKDAINPRKGIPVENFPFDINEDKLETVKARLIELQKGYCEGAVDRPRIIPQTVVTTDGKKIKSLAAVSQANFYYVAFLGMKIKENALLKQQ
jgi:hypothetical protein